jgi:hypothetical protein
LLPENLRLAFLTRVLTFVTRLLLAEPVPLDDFAQDAWTQTTGWFLERPVAIYPLSCVLFQDVQAELPPVPNSMPNTAPAWFAQISGEERRFLRAGVERLAELDRMVLHLSFYATLTAEQIRKVVFDQQTRSIEEVVDWLELAYLEVLEGMKTID